jgi:hypothetical protein
MTVVTVNPKCSMNINSFYIFKYYTSVTHNYRKIFSIHLHLKCASLMPWTYFCSHYGQQFYDIVVTLTLGWLHRWGRMKYVTARQSQNMMPLLQQSAKLHKITLQTALAQIYRCISPLIWFIIQQYVTLG